jgi:hypothetical protein
MSNLAENLKKLGIGNDFQFAGHGNPYIVYYAATVGRGSRYARWTVVRPGFVTDKDAHFLDHGCKTFAVSCKEQKEPVLLEATGWAGARYGITEWVKTPFRSYMAADFVQRRLAELKATKGEPTA